MKNDTAAYIDRLTSTMDKISKTSEKSEICHIIDELLLDFTNSDHASLFLFDKAKQSLRGSLDGKTVEIPMIEPEGLLGKSFLTKEAAIYNHAVSEKEYVPGIDNPNGNKIKSIMLFPLTEEDNLIAILCMSRDIYNNKKYSNHDLSLLESLSLFLVKIVHILISDKTIQPKIDINPSDVAAELESLKRQPRRNRSNESNLLFLSNTVHDIRTPANTLHGFLELIEDRIEDKRIKEFIENAKESAQFINSLIDTILDTVKYQKEAEASKLVTVHAARFFSRTANLFSSKMYAKKIEYIIYIDPTIPKEIKVDTHKLKRVIINLIGNAYKFTQKEKQIHFSVKFDHHNKKLKIFVKDQGLGIEKSRQKDIFKAFEQAEDDIEEKYGGTGLGLSICSDYVKEMGGKIKLKSEIDKGSKFSFSIPVDIVDSTPAFEPFCNLEKKITILTDHPDSGNVDNIIHYLTALNMPSERIIVSNRLDNDTTHLFCFQHKLTPEILHTCEEKDIKLILVEEELFSVNQQSQFSHLKILSKNTYYGDIVHDSVFSGKRLKVLIADDNKINILLLKAMLESEYCDISTVMDGEEALNTLKTAAGDHHPFDIIFLDKHMPGLSGSEAMHQFRLYEQEQNLKPIFSISITGDPDITSDEKDLYNMLVNKPFKKQDILGALERSKQD